ncbi:MAG: M48 family peptidase, partial [Rubrivivax sp.]
MQPSTVTLSFAALVLVSLVARLWLAARQMRHVVQHRDRVPAPFAGTVTPAMHQKAADYTLAKGRLSLLSIGLGTLVLLGWTLLGGLDSLNVALRDALQPRFGDLPYQLALLAAFVA